jgi:hypothetical protein
MVMEFMLKPLEPERKPGPHHFPPEPSETSTSLSTEEKSRKVIFGEVKIFGEANIFRR